MGECGHGPVLLDREGLFLKICKLQQTTTASVVEATKEHLARQRVPVTVHSDGGPQFSSQELQTFDKEWEFEHTMSSPYNSHSNGRAKSPVKIAKGLFKNSADPYMALLEWRNTPTIDMGSTPSQRLFSRRTWW